MSDAVSRERSLSARWLRPTATAAFFVALGLWLFFPYLFGGKILFTNDAVLTANRYEDLSLWRTLLGTWRDDVLVGLPRYVSINLPLLLRRLLRAELWNDAIWPIATVLSSLALVWYLRLKRIDWLPAILAALVGCWLGVNFTLVYAGHTMKPFVVLFFLCSLAFTHRLVTKGRWFDAVLLGGSAGAMFMHQADVAFLFALALGAHVVFEFAISGRWRSPGSIALLATAAAVCALLSAGPLLNGYRQYGENTSVSGNPTAKWNYMTQWSWPPEDSISFLAPGFVGWKSFDVSGPYWGRMGRSSRNEPADEQFWNLKIEDYYLGVLPFGLAVLALAGWRRMRGGANTWFWLALAVVSLLLAFGKYFPLYRFFFELPVVSSIRNPNKFLQIFQVAIAVLAGYGAHALLRACASRGRLVVGAQVLFYAIALAALGWGLLLDAGKLAEIQRLMSAGWGGSFAQTIAELKIASVFHVAALAGIVGVVLTASQWRALATGACKFSAVPGVLLVAIITGDAVLLAGHYLKEMPRSYIADNPLTEVLANSPDRLRTHVLNPRDVNNIWLTYLLPYHGFDLLNVVLIPRMPADYANYMTAMKANPAGLWQQTATGHLLVSRADTARLLSIDASSELTYNVRRAPDRGFEIERDPEGEFSLLTLESSAPRFLLVAGAKRLGRDEALKRLADNSLPAFESVFVEEGARELSGKGVTGSVKAGRLEPGNIELHTDAPVDTYLRIARRFDPDWHAWVDGEPVNLQRADYLFQAVYLPAGAHEVVLKYEPPIHFLVLQLCGLAAAAIALVGAIVSARRPDPGDGI